MKVVLRITRSQQMAVLDVIMEAMRCPAKPQHSEVFVNVSESPAVETTLASLLEVFGNTSELETEPDPKCLQGL